MKVIIQYLIIAFLLCIKTYAQSDFISKYGNKLLCVAPYDGLTLKFYENHKDQESSKQISFTKRTGMQDVLEVSEGKDNVSWFEPALFKLDVEYSLLYLFLFKEQNNKYLVKVNRNEYMWLEKSPGIELISWEAFFQAMCSVEVIDTSRNFLQKMPNKNSDILYNFKKADNTRQHISALKIKGDWMKVRVTLYDGNSNFIKELTGWILWKDKKDFLVKYNLMCC